MKSYTLIVVVALCALAGCNIDRQAQKEAKETAKIVTNPVQTVGVEPAKVVTLTRGLEVTGQVTTSSDTQVGAKTAGRIVAVNVRDGDRVHTGQVLVLLDTTPLLAQVNQAQAGVLTAQSAMAQARSALAQAIRNAQINPQRSTAGVLSARAALRFAQANLTKVIAGARPQERLQAQANVNSAKTALTVQEKELGRVKTLVQQGALAGNQLDIQEATYQSALAAYENATQAMSLINQGNRQEDIDAAREQVREAQQALKTAQSTKELDTLYKDQVDAAQAQVESARAQIQTAQSQVVIARQALSDAVIRAPFDGNVSGRPIEVGSIAVPGTTLMRIVGSQGIYFEGNVPSDNIAEINVGMPVSISVDAVGTKTYPGKVAAISPAGSAVGRLFNVRIQFQGVPSEIRPGMFARGSIAVETVPNATVVPATSVQSRGNEHFVFIAEAGKAKKLDVQLGLEQGDLVQVKGLPAGSQVIVQGQDRVSDKSPIIVQKPVGKITASPSFGSALNRGQG